MDPQRQFRLLVPCDISPPSEAALAAALVLAEPLGAQVDVLHVCQSPLLAFMDVPIATSAEAAALERAAAETMEAMVRRVAEAYPGAAIETGVRYGAPGVEILAAIDAGRPDLVVMGTHGRGFWSRALMGSVAQGVVRRSAAPVLAVHGPDPTRRALKRRPSRILVPMEFDEVAIGALDSAFSLAKQLGSALHVQFSYGFYDVGYPVPMSLSAERIAEGASEHLRRVVEERRVPGVPVEMTTHLGSAVSGILEAASDERVGMIVMGTHRRTTMARLLEGSVAEDVIRLAPCPVLTVGEGASTNGLALAKGARARAGCSLGVQRAR